MLYTTVAILVFFLNLITALPQPRHDDRVGRSLVKRDYIGILPRPNGLVSAAYFTSWGLHTSNYSIDQVPVESLTHLLYAYADVSVKTGAVHLTFPEADTDKLFSAAPGREADSASDPPGYLHGNLKQLFLLKKKNRHLKTMLSIGGWASGQADHFAAVSTSAGRTRFTETAVNLLETFGFDGLDIDWQYPNSDQDMNAYVELLAELRCRLDRLAEKKAIKAEDGYQLSVAAPTAERRYSRWQVKKMDQYISFWFLTAYNYAGADFSRTSSHQADLPTTNVATDWYMEQGIDSRKLVLGIPLFGVSFSGTEGLGASHDGHGGGDAGAGGKRLVKNLPLPYSVQKEDRACTTTECFRTQTRDFVSYDTVRTAQAKYNWMVRKNMGGLMFWDVQGDHDQKSDKSIISGTTVLFLVRDTRENHLHYPESPYPNIQNQMYRYAPPTSRSLYSDRSVLLSDAMDRGNAAPGESFVIVAGDDDDLPTLPPLSIPPSASLPSTLPSIAPSIIPQDAPLPMGSSRNAPWNAPLPNYERIMESQIEGQPRAESKSEKGLEREEGHSQSRSFKLPAPPSIRGAIRPLDRGSLPPFPMSSLPVSSPPESLSSSNQVPARSPSFAPDAPPPSPPPLHLSIFAPNSPPLTPPLPIPKQPLTVPYIFPSSPIPASSDRLSASVPMLKPARDGPPRSISSGSPPFAPMGSSPRDIAAAYSYSRESFLSGSPPTARLSHMSQSELIARKSGTPRRLLRGSPRGEVQEARTEKSIAMDEFLKNVDPSLEGFGSLFVSYASITEVMNLIHAEDGLMDLACSTLMAMSRAPGRKLFMAGDADRFKRGLKRAGQDPAQ